MLWRKAVVTVLGGLMALAGFVMLFTPGPGLLTLAGGLAMLGTEYRWAKRLTTWVRAQVRRKAVRR